MASREHDKAGVEGRQDTVSQGNTHREAKGGEGTSFGIQD